MHKETLYALACGFVHDMCTNVCVCVRVCVCVCVCVWCVCGACVCPMKKSCQDLFKILQESGQKSSNTRFSHGFGTRILQDKKDSCKFEKLAWIWNRFLANLPNLETSWQDLARYF